MDFGKKNVVLNDIDVILEKSSTKYIFTNGSKSYSLYKKYLEKETHIKAIALPSTSPANAKFSLDKLVDEWKIILDYI